MPTATVWSKGAKGENIRIFLQTTKRPDEGYIQQVTWKSGLNPAVDKPTSVMEFALYHIRAVQSGLTCKADVLGPFDPDVGCRLVKTATQREVVITLPYYGDTHYPLAQDDFDELTVFLAQSKFPT